MNSSSAWLPSSSSASSTAAATNKMEEGKRRKSRTKPKLKSKPKLRGINSDTDADDHSDECTTSGDWLPKTLIIENKIMPSNANTNAHANKNSDEGCGGSWIPKCLSNRKVICGIIFYAVVATVLWSFFFSRSFSLFNRQSQIEELTAQVQILDGEIDELEIQVDRLGGEVDRLGNETDRLENINGQLNIAASGLNDTLFFLAGLNSDLNITGTTQEELTQMLNDALADVGVINDLLQNSISALGDRIESISDLNGSLNSTIVDLEEEKEHFKDISQSLNSTNIDLDARVSSLEIQLFNITEQNDSLSQHNKDLRSIVTFLNQAAIDFNSTVEGVAGYLADDIEESIDLVLGRLELSYQDVSYYWRCATSFEYFFEDKVWMKDRDVAIGSNSNDYNEVMEFVEEHVLDEMCASRSDFELFLTNDNYIGYTGSSPPVNISFNNLVSGIERYSSLMMEYYFPEGESNGLSKDIWTNARYNCQNIPTVSRYVWTQEF